MNKYQLVGLGCPGEFDCNCLNGLGNTFTNTPDREWTCAEWMFWHKDLAAAYQDGRLAKYSRQKALDEANRVFAYHWEHAIPWYDAKKFWSSCSYGSDFVEYFKSVGYTDHISFVGAIVSKGADVSVDVTDTAGNVVDAAGSTSNVLKWLVPTLLVGAVAGAAYYAYKNYLKGNRKIKAGNVEI